MQKGKERNKKMKFFDLDWCCGVVDESQSHAHKSFQIFLCKPFSSVFSFLLFCDIQIYLYVRCYFVVRQVPAAACIQRLVTLIYKMKIGTPRYGMENLCDNRTYGEIE